MKLTFKRVLVLLFIVGGALVAFRDVYPLTIITWPIGNAIKPFIEQASTFFTDIQTSISENKLALGPVLAIAAPVGGILIKGVHSRITSLKTAATQEIGSMKGQMNSLFTEKARLEQEVASMTGHVTALQGEKESLDLQIHQLKGELLDLRQHESDLMEQKKLWHTEKQGLQRTITQLLDRLTPEEQHTYVQ